MWGFVIVVLILAIAIPLAIAHNKKTNLAWSDAARTLGLSYRPGGFLQSRRIEGQLKGMRVVVDTFTRSSGKHSTSYTRYRISYPRSLGLGLQLQREGMLSTVTKLFGAQDIQIGDVSFDNAMLVKGRNELGIREFLTPPRRMRIQRFIAGRSEAVIDDTSIRYTKAGIASNSRALVSAIQSMARLGWHLIEEQEDDDRLQQVMQLRNEGDPEAALRVLEKSVQANSPPAKQATDVQPIEAFLTTPVEEKRMRGELQYMSGDRQGAHRTFQEVQNDDPDDEEIVEWLKLTEDKPTPPAVPSENVSADSQASQAEASASDAGSPPADEVELPSDPTEPIDSEQFCDELFGKDVRSFDVNTQFEQRYQGRTVQWSGELTKIERNYSSFIFEQSGGTKATYKIDERPSPYYGTHDVLAVVHLSEAEGESLKGRVGQTIGFTGELVKADGLMRNVYLDHGQTT